MPPLHSLTRLALLRARNRGGTSDFARDGIEDALARRGLPEVDNDAAPVRIAGKVLKNLGLQRQLLRWPRRAYVAALMGPETFRVFPHGYFAEIVPYIFDCWPADYAYWERFLRSHKIAIAFFSAHQSAERMAARVPGLQALWLPEGIDLTPYRDTVPIEARHIDLLEFGRRNEAFHDLVTGHCVARGYNHRYQRSATELAFADRQAFIDGLADSRILACFPSSLTHPDRSGDVETLTLRYLEGMASGCILLGRCPGELRTLFGYDPVVTADLENPGAQIDAILAAPNAFADLIARNSVRLREVGTWDSRVASMLKELAARGYVPAMEAR